VVATGHGIFYAMLNKKLNDAAAANEEPKNAS